MLLLCCLIGVVCALDRVVMSIAILPMTEEYAFSDSTKGAIAAGFSVGYCLGLVPTGAAASAGSPKLVLLVGLLVWSLAQLATPAAAARVANAVGCTLHEHRVDGDEEVVAAVLHRGFLPDGEHLADERALDALRHLHGVDLIVTEGGWMVGRRR